MRPTYKEAVDIYLAANSHLAPTSRKVHEHWLFLFGAHCRQQHLDWVGCRAEDLERFHQTLLWQPHSRGQLYKSNTVEQARQVLRKFYRWARLNGHILLDPTSSWQLSSPIQSDQPVLSREQLLALLNLPDLSQPTGIRDQLLLELIALLSLSLGECRTLRVDQVEGDYLQRGERQLELAPVRPSLERYLTRSRPQRPSPILLLTSQGRPFSRNQGLARCLWPYGKQLSLGCSLCTRILHRTHQAELTRLAARHTRMVD